VKALEGLRVLDLSRMLSGPYATMLLADLGAEVIKIEEPRGGDPMRAVEPYITPEMSAYFASINRNKRSVTLDLKTDEGKQIVLELAKKCDVVLENFRPGTMESLGLGYETLKTANPEIIHCSITGFGESGPLRDYPSFDLVIQAMSGQMSITGEPGRPPVRSGIPIGDLAAAMMACIGVLSALARRARGGGGGRVEVSLLDAMVSMLSYVAQFHFTDGRVPGPVGSAHQSVVPYQAFKTRDGYIVVAVFVEKFWEAFCQGLGLPELVRDPRFLDNSKRAKNRAVLVPMLEARFLEKSSAEWLEALQERNVPCGPIHTIDRILSHPQLVQNNMLIELEVPGKGLVKGLGNPIKIEGHEDSFEAPPLLGEDTERLLSETLRMPRGKIAALREKGVI
jgi:crotonobetainyl-CoA:carnitine CoA-transferase CaiB-like acyl-CoA transferase